MKSDIYHKWTSIMTNYNSMGWGIDQNLYQILKLNLGLFHCYTAHHWFG